MLLINNTKYNNKAVIKDINLLIQKVLNYISRPLPETECKKNIKLIKPNDHAISLHIKRIIKLADRVHTLSINDYGSMEYEEELKHYVRVKQVINFLTSVYETDWEQIIVAFCPKEADLLIKRCIENGLIIHI